MSAALAATELVLAREQKLHALDGLAAAAAHELGTPLSTIAVVPRKSSGGQRQAVRWPRTSGCCGPGQRCRDILQKLTRRPTSSPIRCTQVSVTQLIDEAADPIADRNVDVSLKPLPSAEATRAGGGTEAGRDLRPRQPCRERRRVRRERVEITAVDGTGGHGRDRATTDLDFAARCSTASATLYDDHAPSASSRQRTQRGAAGLGLGFFIAKTLSNAPARSLLGNKARGPRCDRHRHLAADEFEGSRRTEIAR